MKKKIINRKISGIVLELGNPVKAELIIEKLQLFKGKLIYLDDVKNSNKLNIVELIEREETDEEERKRESKEKEWKEHEEQKEKELYLKLRDKYEKI